MHRELFRPPQPGARREPVWEPPVDRLETEDAVLILVALPGVDPDQIAAVIEDDALMVSGRRALPPELRHASCCPRATLGRHLDGGEGREGAP